jgi:hypothetical protein
VIDLIVGFLEPSHLNLNLLATQLGTLPREDRCTQFHAHLLESHFDCVVLTKHEVFQLEAAPWLDDFFNGFQNVWAVVNHTSQNPNPLR